MQVLEHCYYLMVVAWLMAWTWRAGFWNRFYPKMTGTAQVLEKRVHYRNGWNYSVTFSLGGLEKEFSVTENVFCQLKEGDRGQLLWRHQEFLEFTDEESFL